MPDECQCNLCDMIEHSTWVSVKDRLPDCEKCLAIVVTKKDCYYNLRHDGWFRDTIYSCRMSNHDEFIIESHGPLLPATHWMPLPTPPEME